MFWPPELVSHLHILETTELLIELIMSTLVQTDRIIRTMKLTHNLFLIIKK